MTSGAMTVGAASGGAVTDGVGREAPDVEGVSPTTGAGFRLFLMRQKRDPKIYWG